MAKLASSRAAERRIPRGVWCTPPYWLELPVPDTPLARVLGILLSVKGELDVDEEPRNLGKSKG